MARTLSQDLRDRVVAAIDGGMSCHAAAARFGVSVSSAIRWRRLALEHGRAVAKPRGGDRHSGRIEAHGGFIRELIAEQIPKSGSIVRSSSRARPLSMRAHPSFAL
jgi:transposase